MALAEFPELPSSCIVHLAQSLLGERLTETWTSCFGVIDFKVSFKLERQAFSQTKPLTVYGHGSEVHWHNVYIYLIYAV